MEPVTSILAGVAADAIGGVVISNSSGAPMNAGVQHAEQTIVWTS
jgi:hypothetical protein